MPHVTSYLYIKAKKVEKQHLQMDKKRVEMEGEYLPLFETKQAKGRIAYILFSISMFVGICMIFAYRVTHIQELKGEEKWVWISMFLAELWFGFYWFLIQAVRWNRVYRYTFKDRLSQRYEEKLPGVDVFVCTADPIIEPPIMVINTVLSVMAYNYPAEKLSVYLSDDGASDLTFYAMLEASHFAKHWIPFCKEFNIEPRSPTAYFSTTPDPTVDFTVLSSIKSMYEEMEHRIGAVTKLGRIPEEVKTQHKAFSEWTSVSSRRDHQTILQVLINSKDAVDITGNPLPTLVYLAREKRPSHPHNFKAGALNALIRVSSKISNGKIILTIDCDMYSNNSETARDTLCFFMDEHKSHDIAFIQFSQLFNNITKNDLYGSSMVALDHDLPGMDGCGGPSYIGTGCFHRRDTLCGKKYTKACKFETLESSENIIHENITELEDTTKLLADCSFEDNTEWGKEMGLKYNCPVEDVITGISIHCRGWKSAYFNPTRRAFLGIAPQTLDQTLVQHKRWSEGVFQVLLSKFGPLSYGLGRINLKHTMAYSIYCSWPINSLPTLCYSVVPSLCLLKGISIFPRISSPWFLPFAYVIIGEIVYSSGVFLWCGGTLKGWWNEQRIWMYKRTTSYLFAFMDTMFKLFGFTNSTFNITVKVVDEDVMQRYEKEMMEFGTSSPMFIILTTLALLNLFGLVGGLKRVVLNAEISGLETTFLQVLLCGVVVILNLPLYQALFFRSDDGRMPTSVTIKSFVLAFSACSLILK